MDYKLISAPLDKMEYLFFAGSFKNRSTFYKIAVAEQVSYLGEGYSGYYSVLMQSEAGTLNFNLYKNDMGIWVCDDEEIANELLFQIGEQIDKIKE